jgi:hypothetical protein
MAEQSSGLPALPNRKTIAAGRKENVDFSSLWIINKLPAEPTVKKAAMSTGSTSLRG